MDFRIILVFVLLGEIAVSETTKMRMWERRCLVTHNKIRSNRGIGAVSRSALLTEKADLKGLHLVLNEYKIHIAGLADINSSLLQKERISFSTEILSKTLLFPRSSNARDFRMQLYLSLAAEDMIMKWVENGLFSLDNKERYDRMMDPSVDKIGCALHYVPVQGNVYKIYVVVAYQLNEKKWNGKSQKISLGQNSVHYSRSYSLPSRTCEINCFDAGSCYSHNKRNDRSMNKSGVEGYGTKSPGNQIGLKDCRCEFDVQLWELGTNVYKETPTCFGPCFVYCPLAKVGAKTSCHGETLCTCKYAQGGASCK